MKVLYCLFTLLLTVFYFSCGNHKGNKSLVSGSSSESLLRTPALGGVSGLKSPVNSGLPPSLGSSDNWVDVTEGDMHFDVTGTYLEVILRGFSMNGDGEITSADFFLRNLNTRQQIRCVFLKVDDCGSVEVPDDVKKCEVVFYEDSNDVCIGRVFINNVWYEVYARGTAGLMGGERCLIISFHLSPTLETPKGEKCCCISILGFEASKLYELNIPQKVKLFGDAS
jgi:hypothetical protein